MKKTVAICIFAGLACASCRNAQQNDIVKETYIHKYGVPIAKTEWDHQGKDGQTVNLHKDGVTVASTYSKGVLNGPCTFTFPNSSTIQKIEVYSQGELVSKKENYLSGVPFKEEIFENQMLVELIQWYEDGTPHAHEFYENSFLVSGEYRTPANIIESRVMDGHGTRIWCSNEGNLLSKDTIQNGQMTERVTYFTNGDPATVTPYLDGSIHGTRLTFLQGGLPNTVEQWVHGMQEGITVSYQNGEKISEATYAHGKKNGIEYRYRDGTLLVEELSWEDDVQHGQRKIFVDGTTKSEWYHEGEMVSRNTFERRNIPHRRTAV
jgi:antitoxin component YwqK of YwqJK toxin-antitoxin module